MDNKIKILQWNARSAIANKYSLMKCLSEHKIDIAAISETWFQANKRINFPGYQILRTDRDDGYGGTAILINKAIQYKKLDINLDINENINICGTEINFKKSCQLKIISLYCPPKINISNRDWEKIFNLINSTQIKGIICGDFNAHHRAWGSYKNDQRGSQIIGILDNYDLVFTNDGSPTRLNRNGENSVVDITLSTPCLVNNINWNTIKDTLGSDHFPIIIDITMTANSNIHADEMIHPTTKWNTKKANWITFENEMEEYFSQERPTFNNLNEKYLYLIEGINSAAQTSIPTNKPFKPKQRPIPPWWDDECDAAVRDRKNAVILYKANSTLENFLTVKHIEASTKKFLKGKARSSWRTYCAKLNKNTPISDIWKQARKMKRNLTPPNSPQTNNNTWVETFLEKMAPPSVRFNPSLINDPDVEEKDCPEVFKKSISLEELEGIIKQTHNTAPGFDNIKYPILDNLPKSAKMFLLEIFNDIIKTGECDIKEWKNVIIVPILKPQKDPNNHESYRAISLLSCILKTFERILKNRLEWWLKQNNILPIAQYGFKKGYGTLDAVAHLVTDIQNTFSENGFLAGIFLDVKGAYDAVEIPILKGKLGQIGLPKKICNVLCQLISDRKIFIRQKTSLLGPRLTSRGLPQGSVLSPLLFNIYTISLHHTSTDYQIIQYADDFVIYVKDKKYQNCLNKIDMSINPMLKGIYDIGFDLATAKSSVNIFTRHHTPILQNIKLGNVNFPYKEEVKYLGVILDKKLNWKSFIEYIKVKCMKAINFLKVITRTWWGANTETCLLFYKSYIRSILDYGSVLYGAASNASLKQLEVTQNKALRICLGAMPSTPIEPLRVEALETPLELRREFLAEKMILKCQLKKSHLIEKVCSLNTQDLTNKYWEKKNSPPLCIGLRNINDTKVNTYVIKNYFENLECPVQIIIPIYSEISDYNQQIINSIVNENQNGLIIYTDASKNNEGTGTAFFVKNTNVGKTFTLQDCSIFTAEAAGIMKALEYATEGEYQKVAILSDSLSVLKCLEKTINIATETTHPYIIKIKSLLHHLGKKCKIQIIWVKAHCGIIGNERADQLAKESIYNGEPLIEELCISDCINTYKKYMQEKWARIWENYVTNKPTRYTMLQRNIPKSFWYKNFNYTRKEISCITRMKFGHAAYPAHLHKIGVIESNICPECNAVADLDHIFFECVKYRQATKELHKNLNKLKIYSPINMMYLLALNDKHVLDCVLKFIKTANILL